MGDFPVTKRVFCLPYAENSSLSRGNKPRLTGASFLLYLRRVNTHLRLWKGSWSHNLWVSFLVGLLFTNTDSFVAVHGSICHTLYRSVLRRQEDLQFSLLVLFNHMTRRGRRPVEAVRPQRLPGP